MAIGSDSLSSNTSGYDNTASGFQALNSNTTGYANVANGTWALYSKTSGNWNVANGYSALDNNTTGSNNIALGTAAGTLTTGDFNIDIGNIGRAGESGTIRIGIQGTHTATFLSGNVYSNGAFTNTSDRNAKENFFAIDAEDVLNKVADLPLSGWSYKDDKQHTQHLGPMAQDFYAAFGLGTDDKHIATVDESGVALAAIQGLYQKLQEKDQEIAGLKNKSDSLEGELARVTHKSDRLEQELAAIKAKLGME